MGSLITHTLLITLHSYLHNIVLIKGAYAVMIFHNWNEKSRRNGEKRKYLHPHWLSHVMRPSSIKEVASFLSISTIFSIPTMKNLRKITLLHELFSKVKYQSR